MSESIKSKVRSLQQDICIIEMRCKQLIKDKQEELALIQKQCKEETGHSYSKDKCRWCGTINLDYYSIYDIIIQRRIHSNEFPSILLFHRSNSNLVLFVSK